MAIASPELSDEAPTALPANSIGDSSHDSLTARADKRVFTCANCVTMLRILAAPFFILMVAAWGPSWTAFAFGFTIAATDYLDGYLARRFGATCAGAWLDPLADKVLVLGGLAALVWNGQFWWLPVAIIAVRATSISCFRVRCVRRGISVPATKLAKWKTCFQLWAIGFAVVPPIAEHAHWIATLTLWIAVALTVQTGWAYLYRARRSTQLSPASS